MRLLVSVRSAEEAVEAVAGGAEIIDAKEPARGPLGQVEPAVGRRILAALAPTTAFSAALGDPPTAALVAAAVEAVPSVTRTGPVLLKIGLAGAATRRTARERLAWARDAVARHASTSGLIVVAYADAAAADAPPPAAVLDLAAEAEAAGVLMDTWNKSGPGLLELRDIGHLTLWVGSAERAGLTTALAGRLTLADLERVVETGAGIVGVRG
nr:hypothetical protein [Gemmatimonadales bacterium]